MKKIIPFIFVFILVILATQAFAQSTNWADYGLDEESIKYLSEKEKQDILNSRTPAQTQEYIDQQIKEKGIETVQAQFPLFSSVEQNTTNTPSNPEIVSCFDYYKFGSIEANFSSKSTSAVSGMMMNFSGNIKNNNAYPVVQGTLYVKIFKNIGGEKNPNGPDVVDQFIALDNINLPANGSIPAEFSWKIPSYATTGDYRLVTYFTSDKKFNLLGLSFTDDIVGNSFDFKVSGEKTTLMFDKSSVVINQNPYYFAAYPPRIAQTNTANISLSIDNTTNIAQSAQITWKLYAWDAMNPENFVREFKTNTDIKANSKEQVSFSIPEKEAPVYLLIGELQYKDTKSIVSIRYVRDGVDKVRLNYPAITSYPLVEGQQTTLFTCLHNAGQSAQVQNNKVILEVLNEKGKVIESYTYEGIVTGDMMAVKKDFIPKTNLNTFSVRASLYTDGKLVDESTMRYSCKDIDPTKCTEEKGLPRVQIIIGLISLLLLLVILILIKRKTKGVELMLVLFVISAAVFMFDVRVKDTNAVTALPSNLVNPNITSGSRQVLWNTTLNKTFEYFWNGSDGDRALSGSGWAIALTNPNITIKYNTKIINLNTNEPVLNGSDVPVNSNLRLQFIPHHPYDIYWFGTGASMDSPYGEWKSDALPPDKVNNKVTCEEKDFVNNSTLFTFRRIAGIELPNGLITYLNSNVYIPIVVSPPNKLISNTNNGILSCGALEGNETSGYFVDCVVQNTGQANINFDFQATISKFYYRYFEAERYTGLGNAQWLSDLEGFRNNFLGIVYTNECFGNNIALKDSLNNPYVLEVPAQTISYTLNAVAAPAINQPPNPPTITGPTNTTPLTNETFNFVATDPDGNTINYEIDWDQNGTTDQYLPSSGQVTSGTSQSTTKSWTSLPQTFKARTVDQYSATSTWSTYTIISSTPPSLSCSTTPSSITIQSGYTSETSTLQATVSSGTSPYTYEWYDQDGVLKRTSSNQAGTTNSYTATIATTTNLSYPSNNNWQVQYNVNVTDANTGSASALCTINVTDGNMVDLCTQTPGNQFYLPTGTTKQADGSCTCNNGGVFPTCAPKPSATSFFFNSNTVPQGQQCPLYLTVSGANQCELRNRLGTLSAGPFDGPINIQGTQTAPIGTHTLWCKATATSTLEQLGTQASCFSVSDVKEI